MSDAAFFPPLPLNERVLDYLPGSEEVGKLKVELANLSSKVEDLGLFSSFASGEKVIEVRCPHEHSKVLAKSKSSTAKDTEAAISKLLATQKAWSALAWQERAAIFLKAADLLAGPYRAKMNAATMLGQSKTVYQAEIDAACELADFFRFNVAFARDIYGRQPFSPSGAWNRLEMRGLEGFVMAIAPFNFTSIAVNLAAAPALMGSVVLWKPSETSLLACQVGFEVLKEAGLPDGVIVPVLGDPREIGVVALSHPSLAGVHFTGSTQTFQSIWSQIGSQITKYRTFPRLVGETGGKDFILADQSADPEALVTALIRGAFEFQGQKCSAASRAYIPERLWLDIKGTLIERTQSLAMGDPSNLTQFMAAVIDERAYDKITGFIARARKDPEVKIVAGGDFSKDRGYFIRPTIIETKNPHSETMVQEIFGPF